MFIEDGLNRKNRATNAAGKQSFLSNASLLVGVDGVDAFCRVNGAIAVRALKQAGLHAEAYWIANFLTARSLRVKEDDELSDSYSLECGVPQGTILGPLIWSLVINGLLKKLEAKCDEDQQEKVISSIITYADDINFVVKSYDHSACIDKANELLEIVNEWSVESGVPLGKMQSIWVGSLHGGAERFDWVKNWKKEDGELVCGNLRDVPTSAPPAVAAGFEQQQQKERTFKILGIKYSPSFRFIDHAKEMIDRAQRQLAALRPMATTCSSMKMKVLYEALVLSPLLYCCECWYPYIDAEHRKKMEAIHLDGCRMIVRATRSSRTENVYAEAGFRSFRDLVHDRLISLAECIKRLPGTSEFHGTGWVKHSFFGVNLHRNEDPTAGARRIEQEKKYQKRIVTDFKPPTIRDIDDDMLAEVEPQPSADPFFKLLDRLLVLDKLIPPSAFDSSAPGGLTKSETDERLLAAANRERISSLDENAVFVFPDGSAEGNCSAGKIAGGASIWHKGKEVAAVKGGLGLYGCSFTAEIRTIEMVLNFLDENGDALFPLEDGKRPHIYFVGDSRSSISALATGPLRQTSRTEQRCWELLIELAEKKFSISFHFIFSHCGVKENDMADGYAKEAMDDNATAPIWRKDAVRLRRSLHHRHVDAALSLKCSSKEKFEFSTPLRMKLSRADEQLLFRARIDCIPEIGGHLHESSDLSIFDCPLCRAVGVLGRGGKTTRHLNNCPSAPLPPGKSLSDLLFGEELAAVLHLRLFRQARFDLLNNNNNNIRNDNAAAALENENQEQQHEQEVSDSNSSSESESSSSSGDSESERDSLDSE